jgi:succinyl-diaminopimelate desuccinylase
MSWSAVPPEPGTRRNGAGGEKGLLKDWVKSFEDEAVHTLQQLLQIESVKGTPGESAPFGEGPAAALDFVLSLAREHGFIAESIDGYAGHIVYGDPNDAAYIGVLGHLDVVPAGAGWTHPPFAAQIHDGNIYARGALDDKGPSMSALWALVALKELGMKPNRPIRLILGLDEESDWDCVDHYFSKQPKPLGGFTPDADFPMIHAEKGVTTISLKLEAEQDSMVPQVVSFHAGHRVNMVPDYAYAEVDCHSETAASEWEDRLYREAKQRSVEIDVARKGEVVRLTVHGVSAHGSTPDNGINAILLLATLLAGMSVSNGSMWRTIAAQTTDGRGLGIDSEDEVTGALTTNLGRAILNDGYYDFMFNIRYPIDQTIDELVSRCKEHVSDKWEVRVMEYRDPLFVPLDSPIVQTLRRVYEEQVGGDSTPLAIGGATYARAIPNAVAFGAMFPGMADVAHQKDEFWPLSDYLKCIEIYAHAMYELANTL